MQLTWSLDALYTGYQDAAFLSDMEKLGQLVAALPAALETAKTQSPADALTTVLTAEEELYAVEEKLFSFLVLRQNADTMDNETASLLSQVSRKAADATPATVAIHKFISATPNLEAVLEETPFLREYKFRCLEIQKEVSHKFSDETEAIIAKMDLTGGDAWARLFDYLTSTVSVDYEGGSVTLSEIRNLAHSTDADVRKAAYEAELAAYDKVKVPIAFALNNIKNQVRTLCELRGYESPLAMTLEQSRMKPETLDAMFTAMREGMPTFHRYLRAKAKLLGHEGGLPWYDLFAPVGKTDYHFTVEETRDYLVDVFGKFAPDSAALMAQAFEENWVDFMPRTGKVGGAFCHGLAGMDESRILTNFCYDFESVNTLAHELGHAYHNRQLHGHRIMNLDCPMQIAETASTFNETHLGIYALSQAQTDEERLALLELMLCGTNQVICDIYSRFLFEDGVFSRCQEEFLMPEELEKLMLSAQREAYGDGLDHSALHPYMWCCKGHYYSSGLSYYNFPYAFGAMLSMGLYAMFQREGEEFLPRYRALLHATSVMSLEDIGAMAGIDLTDADFWRSSLNAFGELIGEYEALVDKMRS